MVNFVERDNEMVVVYKKGLKLEIYKLFIDKKIRLGFFLKYFRKKWWMGDELN